MECLGIDGKTRSAFIASIRVFSRQKSIQLKKCLLLCTSRQYEATGLPKASEVKEERKISFYTVSVKQPHDTQTANHTQS